MLRYGITKVLEVPIGYAYAWCTDFRDDDAKIVGVPFPRHILRKRRGEYVWIQRYIRGGKEKEGVRFITLEPPNAWHNEAIGDEKESSIDYRLTPMGKKRTRLTITVRATYKTMEPEAKSGLEDILSRDWDKYGAALEKDYASGKAATA
jgi:hypothetical protein